MANTKLIHEEIVKQEIILDLPQQSNTREIYKANVGIDISFTNLTYIVPITINKQKVKKTILENVSGIFKAGEVSAIMGPSGAGKTSLLNILCKRIEKSRGNDLIGTVYANNKQYSYNDFPKFATYVMQDDRLFETLTVRETIMFAINLRVEDTPKEKVRRVDEIIRLMQLTNCANTYIGGNFVKGISGGERKRTSIAFELAMDPKVIFLDEPTSGLDSFTAYLVIKLLKDLAKSKNRNVIFTIHQPSYDIWSLFDRIMLLTDGKSVYQGSGGQSVENYFKRINFNFPTHSNPADFVMNIMHQEHKTIEKNKQIFFQSYQTYNKPIVENEIAHKSTQQFDFNVKQNSFAYEMKQVAIRTIKQSLRNPVILRARLVSTLMLSLLIGIIYYQLPSSNTGNYSEDMVRIQDRNGSLFLCTVAMFNLSMLPSIITFPAEKAVFLKEENSKLYSVSSYFFGRTLIEIPYLLLFPILFSIIVYWMVGFNDSKPETVFIFIFLTILSSLNGNSVGLLTGCAFSSTRVASSMMPLLLLPMMLFGGIFKNRGYYIKAFCWLEYLSPFKYTYEAHIQNEYQSLDVNPDPIKMLNMDFGLWNSAFVLIGLFVAYRLLALIILYLVRQKLQ